ncbi:Acyl carrier protein [Trichinella spiralis]|uniref:Acyl carrier protein n=1 Tax=Trichinella spiralis TaxID=6334 RepID=A0ABR3KA59_TRISP
MSRIMKIINNFLYISSRYFWLPRKAWFSVPKFYRFIGGENVSQITNDSLDHVELMLAVEEEFGIEIPDDEIEKLMTGVKLANYVCKVKGVEN